MTHLAILPIVLPAMLAPFIVLAARYHIGIQRVFSIAGVVAQIAIAIALMWTASDGTILLYQLGDWAAPFGGDLFNLFVFFEVLLIASYGLMIHAGGNNRLRAGVQYVLFNLLGSTLFLFALGAIYAETGSLNMADLALRVQMIDADASVGIRVAAVLLLLVFAIKAALVPLHFWLPSSYAEAPGPVAALFAIMTKVGAYAIIRVYTLIFPPDLEVTSGLFDVWLLPAALVSLALGMIGVLASKKLDRLVAFAVIGSMGMVLVATSMFTPTSIAAALYYIIHSTLAGAALFLLVDLVKSSRRSLLLTRLPWQVCRPCLGLLVSCWCWMQRGTRARLN